MLSRQFAWVGGITAAVATGLYIFFGPTQRRRSKKKDICPGLSNLGNTCFLNAVLQAFASCPDFGRWLKDFLDRQQDVSKDYLAATIVQTIKVLNNECDEQEDSHYPVAVIDALRSRRWVISQDEQDAHELLQILTQTLDEESTRYPRVVSLFDMASIENKSLKYQTEQRAITKSGSLLPVLPDRDNDLPFRGLLASQLHCIDCGYRNPVRYDLFDSLSLSIPSSVWSTKNLEGLLQHYISAETVQNVECPGCAKLKHSTSTNSKVPLPRSTFCKKLTIGKLPQCLCFHIQRTQWLDNGTPMKRYEHIAFPEILNMDSFVYNKSSRNDMNSSSNGLVGGRDSLMFRTGHSSLKTSGPVNLLRALNYDSNITRNGLFLQPPLSSVSLPDIHSDVNHNAPDIYKFSQSEFTYKLSAVIVHLGDVMSGHFVTYRRSPMTVRGKRKVDRWLYCSDTTVNVVELQDVLQTEAYMLLYERL